MTLSVTMYHKEDRGEWDALVDSARNGLFMHRRDYMEYHADRFDDVSAVARIDGKAVALLPASIDRDCALAISHAGLTFGGVLLARDLRGENALAAIDLLLDVLKTAGARELEVRVLPPEFCTYPSGEVPYGLWRRGFRLSRRDLSTILPLEKGIAFNGAKRRSVSKALEGGVEICRGNVVAFHDLLTDVLRIRHNVAPVHSLSELEWLIATFPEKILLRTATMKGVVLAGILLFQYPTVWHAQYMVASPEGRNVGALDVLIANAINDARKTNASWFSFGTSTTDSGKILNEGLIWQKESFGGRSITHDFMRGVL